MIHVRGLSKRFKLARKRGSKDAKLQKIKEDPRLENRHFNAVKEVNFDVEKGQVAGLLGPNGAGKTTLLRMLATSLMPTAGSAEILGIDLASNPLEIRRRIGFLSGKTGLYDRLTPREMMTYFGTLQGIDSSSLKRRVDELIEQLGMSDYADRRNSTLSTGMKQKVSIARSLVHDPEVVILDEPTTGLDVAASEQILALIKGFRDDGRTVIFSTHHMHEVDRLCDRVVLIDLGEVRFDADLQEMKAIDSSLDRAFLKLIGQEVTDA